MTRPDSILLIPATAIVIGLGMILVQSCGPRWSGDGYHESYELVGMHVGVSCDSCHPADTALGPVDKACESCHEPDRPPLHDSGGCGECHTEAGWGEAVTDHSSFPLVDAHARECVECHGDWSADLDPACGSCHEPDRPLDHHGDLDCGTCHPATTWPEGVFVHGTFPLSGPHDTTCETCHTDGTFTGLDTACASCHEPDRPEGDHHLGRDCGECHAIPKWEDAVDHTFFSLGGGHAIECAQCHIGSDFEAPLDQACSSCHSSEGERYHDAFGSLECSECHEITRWTEHSFDHALFEATTCSTCHESDRPTDHFVDMDCAECHPATGWADGTFDHAPYFPVPHRDANECIQCHLDAPSYGTFSCIDCHDHRRSKMDEVHSGERDYAWNSARCLDCHPTGKGD